MFKSVEKIYCLLGYQAFKEDAEAQIPALLMPEQAQRWQEAQCEPFTFRTDRQK